jgi:molecular chaperone DnaJ
MAAQSSDYYDLLGVQRDASADEIKRAYRNLARKYHPDFNKEEDAAEKFKELQTAYEILSDDTKRQQYDRYGEAAFANNGAGAGFGGYGAAPFGDIFSTFFEDMMGGGRSSTVEVRGDDLRHDTEITLEEAATGVEKTLKYQRLETCDTCEGSGAKPGTSADVCSQCKGQGQVRFSQNTLLGTFHTTQTCPRCKGRGYTITSPCGGCAGTGRKRKTVEKSVKIPAGADTGMRLRLSNEGDAGMNGAGAGDLYVYLHVREHKLFERRGNDLHATIPISYPTLALGGTIQAPLVIGTEEIRIPEGTQSGHTFTLRGRGIPDVRGRHTGDLHLTVHAAVPTHLNTEQREALQRFADTLGEPHTEQKGFFGKLFGH